MERFKKSKTKKSRNCRRNYKVNESEYDLADDPEGTLSVHIQPARPPHCPEEDTEYADRDLPRSSSTQSLPGSTSIQSLARSSSNQSLNISVNSDTPPPCPPRLAPGNLTRPAINRDLKPGRRRSPLDENFAGPPVEPREPQTSGLSSSRYFPTSSSKELRSGVSLREFSRRDKWRTTRNAELRPHPEASCGPGDESANHTSIRHSLDLDTSFSSHEKSKSHEKMPSRRQNHEWPQTKEDLDQHHFLVKEKPCQTYREEDWYVGTRNRSEAEHALHLFNKDGAYLVRDCSRSVAGEPWVLAVYHEKKVYNVKIRFNEKTSKYALGRGAKANDMFESVADIIKFHSTFPIMLVPSDDKAKNAPTKTYPENLVLKYPITSHDIEQLIG